MKPCGAVGAHPVLCLDICNGYAGRLPGYDPFLYRYYFTGAVGNGKPEFATVFRSPVFHFPWHVYKLSLTFWNAVPIFVFLQANAAAVSQMRVPAPEKKV